MSRRALAMITLLGVGGLLAPSRSIAQGPAAVADPAALAKRILDDALPRAERETIIASHPQHAAALITALAADLPPDDAKEAYRRIPWIWRVAIAAGKRDEPKELTAVLAASLPKGDAPLLDWQAVVIGGGLINGVSLAGTWPAARFEALVANDPALAARWRHALDRAAVMTDDERVPTGTRYDALRMLGVEPWSRRGAQIVRYAGAGVDAELQMGAISALADVPGPEATRALLDALPHCTADNRKLALDALLRDAARAAALLDAVAGGRVRADDLGADRIARLTKHDDPAIRQRAGALLK